MGLWALPPLERWWQARGPGRARDETPTGCGPLTRRVDETPQVLRGRAAGLSPGWPAVGASTSGPPPTVRTLPEPLTPACQVGASRSMCAL